MSLQRSWQVHMLVFNEGAMAGAKIGSMVHSFFTDQPLNKKATTHGQREKTMGVFWSEKQLVAQPNSAEQKSAVMSKIISLIDSQSSDY